MKLMVISKKVGIVVKKFKLKCGGLDWFPIDKLSENVLTHIKDVLQMTQRQVYFSSRRSGS